MGKKPFFSLVVPCYNDGRYAPGYYIDRLLSNVLSQGLAKDEIEVIIADDHSIIPYQGTLDRYRDKLNIKFIETDYNFAPGNTRQKGTEVAEGKWLCFADHDDEFYPNALKIVKASIEKMNEKYMVQGDFNKVDPNDHDKIIEEFREPRLGTWVHGKFYNMENFWKPYKIHFIKDLKTHEDLAIGKIVECALHKLGRNPLYIKTPLYKWIWNKDSVSHGHYISQKGPDGVDHDFLETHFNDFLISQIDSIIESYNDGNVSRDEAIMLTLSGLSTAFRMVCAFKCKNGSNYLKSTDAYASRALHKIEHDLDVELARIKVIIKTSFADVMKNINMIADQHGLPDFIEWINTIDTLDYQCIIDREKAELTRASNIAKAKLEAKKAPNDPNHRPFYSIIIPCYNDGRYSDGTYLDRLLSSIARQGLPKYDLEVICSDDCSPVPFESIMAKHENEMIIKYIKTDYNCCPGNTRAKGLTIATGEWLCFADHDDIYYDGALSEMKTSIENKGEIHFALGDFNGVDESGNILHKYEAHLNWCHGKFYNKDNFWDKYGIHFIWDLKSHEDIAICSQVSCILSSYIKNYTYLHKPVYAWTDNPQSVSHAKYTVDTESGPREFLEVFYDDYIHSTGYIYLDYFKAHKIKMINAVKWCLEIMCYCYFYTQGFQFRRPDDYYKKNLDYTKQYIDICKQTFNLDNDKIYNAVANDNASMYYRIRKLADPGSGRYIPTQTFKQWLEIVSPEAK